MQTVSSRPPAPAPAESRWAAALMPVTLALIGGGALILLGVLATSFAGVDNGFWYVSRSSALVAYALLWASMALGVAITNKLARVWPGGPLAFALHQHFSLLGLGFAIVHMVTLLGDTYIGYNLAQVFVPFAGSYQPFWVGLGQLAFYVLIPVTISFYVRKRLGTRAWRTVHGLSYLLFGLTLAHGLFSGTDSHSLWTVELYWFTGAALLVLTLYRLALTRAETAAPRSPARTAR